MAKIVDLVLEVVKRLEEGELQQQLRVKKETTVMLKMKIQPKFLKQMLKKPLTDERLVLEYKVENSTGSVVRELLRELQWQTEVLGEIGDEL